MTATNLRLRGIIPVLLTPMKESGEVDPIGMEKLVQFLIEAGVGGFWAMGSASEDINMHPRERLISLRAASQANASRVPMIAGCGMTSLAEILEFFDQIADLALSGIHVLPYDSKMGDGRLIHFFTTLADRAPFPIWMYHNPKRGKAISRDVIREIREHSNIAGIKVGGYNLIEMTSAIMLQTNDFQVIGAGSGQLYSMLSLGATAHTTSDASAFPEPFVEIYRLFMDGRYDVALKRQFEVIELAQSIPRTENGEYAAEEKFILATRGICEEYVNSLYRNLSSEEKGRIVSAFRKRGYEFLQ